MEPAAGPDRCAIAAEMDQARQTFHRLVDHATGTGLRHRSNGTNGPKGNCYSTCCSAT